MGCRGIENEISNVEGRETKDFRAPTSVTVQEGERTVEKQSGNHPQQKSKVTIKIGRDPPKNAKRTGQIVKNMQSTSKRGERGVLEV